MVKARKRAIGTKPAKRFARSPMGDYRRLGKGDKNNGKLCQKEKPAKGFAMSPMRDYRRLGKEDGK